MPAGELGDAGPSWKIMRNRVTTSAHSTATFAHCPRTGGFFAAGGLRATSTRAATASADVIEALGR